MLLLSLVLLVLPRTFLLLLLLVASFVSAQQQQDDNNNNNSTLLVDCPLCGADPTHIPQDPYSIFTAGIHTLTCDTAYQLGAVPLPPANCTFWQARGATLCQCGDNNTAATGKSNCTLCETKEALPHPRREGAPGRICAQLEVDAKRDDTSCVVWQQTFGIYCGCENPLATAAGQDVCRLCSTLLLPDPLLAVPLLLFQGDDESTPSQSSCGELEFAANLPGAAACEDWQALYGDACCPASPAPSESPPTSGGGVVRVRRTTTTASVLWMLAAGLV